MISSSASERPAVQSSRNPDAAAASRGFRALLSDQWLRWVVVIGILVLWQIGTVVFEIPKFLIPSPIVIGQALWTYRAMLLTNTIPTVEEAAAGFILGNLIAVVLATWFVHVRTARQALYPLAIVIQSIPMVALAPVFVVAMGTGFSSKVAMTTLISFFPTLVNATRGLDAVERPLIELFQSVNASRRDIYVKLRFPNALPYIFLGLRVTATSSVIGAIIAEWVGAQEGLGFMVINSTYEFNAPMLWATLVVSSALVLCVFALVAVVERFVVPWQASAEMATGGKR